MKDFQQLSQHGPWSKIPKMARKTLTQTKTFSSIKPDEHVFLWLLETPEVWPRALRNHNLCVKGVTIPCLFDWHVANSKRRNRTWPAVTMIKQLVKIVKVMEAQQVIQENL